MDQFFMMMIFSCCAVVGAEGKYLESNQNEAFCVGVVGKFWSVCYL
jgi:hypothetical protein